MEVHTYDYSKLRGRIRENQYTQADIAHKLGVSEPTVSSRLNGKSDFSQNEITCICSMLDIKPKEIPLYFFASKLTKT